MNESRLRYKGVTSHVWMSHACHTYKWVTSQTQRKQQTSPSGSCLITLKRPLGCKKRAPYSKKRAPHSYEKNPSLHGANTYGLLTTLCKSICGSCSIYRTSPKNMSMRSQVRDSLEEIPIYVCVQTHTWITHIWMSHGTRMNESWHTYEWVMAHVWMSHGTRMNESWHTYEWVMSPRPESHRCGSSQ